MNEPHDRSLPVPSPSSGDVSRRTAIKVLAAAAAVPVLAAEACETPPVAPPAAPGNPLARGTSFDPDLVAPVVPWDGVLTSDELRTVGALCDVIIPADDRSPAASQVGVPDFIDEWVSYPGHQRDLTRIRGGLVWLDTESQQRFDTTFADLALEQQHAICDDICYVEAAQSRFRPAALFFDRFRDLTSAGFWTTDEGMADVGYTGNVALARFDGAPPEVLERLGLA